MNLSEAADTSDQHLAEAPLDCTTPHGKSSTWRGLPKLGKARMIRVELGLDQQVWPNARRFATFFVTGASIPSDQGSAIRDQICLYPVYFLLCSKLLNIFNRTILNPFYVSSL